MSINTNDNGFVGYEYSEMTVNQSMESAYVDGYRNFGWELEGASTPIGGVSSVVLKFKRDRKHRRMAEVIRLQHQFDSCANEIFALQKAKSLGASAVAYVLGVVGTAFMAGAVFAYLASSIPLMIILAIPGLVGWVIPYFCFDAISKKKAAHLNPIIDQKYDEIYSVCEKANRLINAI